MRVKVKGYSAYADANAIVDDEDKGKLLIKVFQAILAKLDLVKQYIERREYEKKYEELSKVITAIEVLNSSLDMSYGEIPHNLSLVYEYLMKRLREVHRSPDAKSIAECRKILSEISDGFIAAYESEKKKSLSGNIPQGSSPQKNSWV
jgi:flagellar protein FliS